MDFMSENTAEVVERITTEREALRHELEATKRLLEITQGEYKATSQYLDHVIDSLNEAREELEKLKAAQ